VRAERALSAATRRRVSRALATTARAHADRFDRHVRPDARPARRRDARDDARDLGHVIAIPPRGDARDDDDARRR
jgi:hypothetical protein